MTLPPIPTLQTLKDLTPTIYQELQVCQARAAWAAFGQRDALPASPAALLGICFHEVLAAAQLGQLPLADNTPEDAARQRFAECAEARWQQAHAVFRAKFPAPERMPNYYLRREEVALLASRLAQPATPARAFGSNRQPRSGPLIETDMRSADGLLRGRPDVVDDAQGLVQDYKTRRISPEQPLEPTEAEVRQLRLYAYLANENGGRVKRGAIVLPNGTELEVTLSAEDCAREAQQARAALAAFNAAIQAKTTFAALAAPSAEACDHCPCRMLCEPYWRQAQEAWRRGPWVNIRGRIASAETAHLQGTPLLTLQISAVTGTLQADQIAIEHLPQAWFPALADVAALAGQEVCAINLKCSEDEPMRLSVDRFKTEVWLSQPAPDNG
jgi:hypothetical protein